MIDFGCFRRIFGKLTCTELGGSSEQLLSWNFHQTRIFVSFFELVAVVNSSSCLQVTQVSDSEASGPPPPHRRTPSQESKDTSASHSSSSVSLAQQI